MLVPPLLQKQTQVPSDRPIRLAILGSTGSIGRTTLSLVRDFPETFEVVALVANSSHTELAAQISEFSPLYACLTETDAAVSCRQLLADMNFSGKTEVLTGSESVDGLMGEESIDVVVAGIVGMAGLSSVVAALKHGKAVALANKESLVVAGELIKELVHTHPLARIIPVDSEHSAIFQALQGEQHDSIATITLTASGGPFLHLARDRFREITPEEAVRHPRWSMGRKISVDSATLMNKALEVIEAHWLFDLPKDSIKVLVHPQSIVHSLVDFVDGSSIAQLGVPDMRGAIAYALHYDRGRLAGAVDNVDLSGIGTLEFIEPDPDKFPSIKLALDAIQSGGAAALVLNVANEIAVSAFLNGKIRFDQIFTFNRRVVEESQVQSESDLDSLLELELELRLKLTPNIQNILRSGE